MNLKILTKGSENNVTALIGKTGILRIKTRDIPKLEITKADKWFLSFDLDEGMVKKNVYLLKADNSTSYYLSRKMTNSENGLFIDIKILVLEAKIKIPAKCTIEILKEKEYQGLQIKVL